MSNTFNIKIDGVQSLPIECTGDDIARLEDMGFTISEGLNSSVLVSGGITLKRSVSYSYTVAELRDIKHWKSATIKTNGDIVISFLQ